ncbi:hypothetical protein SBOR_0478 [Sclerotinia borealis F-4128]|uniref:CCHC-type domain-containing protein n=1 Tax=Sclerotinia borealis (strain F-4128) TaxID=1432307 RepID=W9CSG8_SCLBF|nr:hypothetical protein SBOR_0478 [Sclerotinia borealis F-4128]
MVSKEESRPKKRWEEEALLELLFRDPEILTDEDLQSISLSNLAKNLNDKLPSPKIMKIYLRWLEAHRKNPSHLLKAWPNTTKQWVESLKHRGVDKEEVISNVKDWKKANSPSSGQSKGWVEEKCPPSVDEIERVFDEKHTTKKDRSLGKVDSGRGGYRSDKSSGKMSLSGGFSDYVPPSYICNRCGENGHSVKQCPTNMDPAFDKKPPQTYQCSLCNKFGKHWYSLCPKNTREDSITQRRLAAGIEVPAVQRSLDGGNCCRERDSGHRRSERWETLGTSDSAQQEQAITLDCDDSEDPELPARNVKLELLADIEERMQKVSAAMAQDTGMSIAAVAEMTGVTISNVAVTIMAANRKRARSMEMDDVDNAEHQRTIRQKGERGDKEELMHDVEDTRFMHSDDERHDAVSGGIFKETDPYTEEFGLSQSLTIVRLTDPTEYSLKLPQSDLDICPRQMSHVDTSSEEDIGTPVDDMEEGFGSPRIRSETPEKFYSDFVKSLIENRTEGQIVNQRRRRPTALEIWDEVDQRRMRRFNTSPSTRQNSPTLSPMSSLASDLTGDIIQVDYPLGHLLDRPLSEISHTSFDNSTPVSPGSDIAMQEAIPEASKDYNDNKYF